MRTLVTGAAGFVGRYLLRALVEHGHSVAGLVHPDDSTDGLSSLGGDLDWFRVDILDGDAVLRALSSSRPDAIYHLAAFSNPEGSWAQARRALEVNILGAHNLLQGVLEAGGGGRPKVLLVGSCQQYGMVGESDQPIREQQPQKPLTPYGVSKASQEMLGQRFALTGLLPVFLVRSFNHTGPGQAASYVCSGFARQIAEIELGIREPRIQVGNLSARRDFSDVRDVVRAYVDVVERGRPGEPYNVCRGEAFSVGQILDLLLERTGLPISVEVSESRYHAVDVPLLLGDNTKLRRDVGWEPRYSLGETLSELLDFWRSTLADSNR